MMRPSPDRLLARRPRIFALVALLALGAGLVGCGDDGEETPRPDPNSAVEAPAAHEGEERFGLTPEQAAAVVARIGEREITVGEVADRLSAQSPYLRARYSNPEQRRAYLDNLVRFELLALEAERRGLDELPEVRRSREQVMVQQMMKDLFEERIRLADVSDADIRAYYAEHERDFQQPEQVRAAHILIRDRALAEQVLREANADEANIEAWRALVTRYTQDEASGGARDGDLRFFSIDGTRNDTPQDSDPAPVDPALARAAFALERVGEVADELVETSAGFHIVKLLGRRGALNRSLAEAERPIRNLLWRERRREAIDSFVQDLREQAHVEIDEAALSAVRLDVPPPESREAEPSAASDTTASDTTAAEAPPAAPSNTAPAEAPPQ